MTRASIPHPAFPAALLLEGRCCLVVGGGRVARRKAIKLAAAGAAIRLVAPEVETRLTELPGIAIFTRAFQPEDLDQVFLAIAATDDPGVNRRVLDLCRERGVLCSAADSQWPEGDLIVPASFTENGLTLSVSTSGHACRRARMLRESLSRHSRFLKDTELLVMGLDHLDGSIEALESLKRTRPEVELLLGSLWGIHEFMILDTCNRFEAVVLASEAALPVLSSLLRRITGEDASLHACVGPDAFRRLAEIASGLRAQALGETRIVAQLKEAISEAQRRNSAGSGLQAWMDTALHLSKEIRQSMEPHLAALETEDLVARYLASERCENEPLLIVGRGEIGQGLARRFPSATVIGGRSDEELRTCLPEAGVVICATGDPGLLLTPSHQPLLRPETLLIDLSIPRNIDPALPRVVGLQALRAILPPGTAKALESVVRDVVQEHRRDYERIVSPRNLDKSGPLG